MTLNDFIIAYMRDNNIESYSYRGKAISEITDVIMTDPPDIAEYGNNDSKDIIFKWKSAEFSIIIEYITMRPLAYYWANSTRISGRDIGTSISAFQICLADSRNHVKLRSMK